MDPKFSKLSKRPKLASSSSFSTRPAIKITHPKPADTDNNSNPLLPTVEKEKPHVILETEESVSFLEGEPPAPPDTYNNSNPLPPAPEKENDKISETHFIIDEDDAAWFHHVLAGNKSVPRKAKSKRSQVHWASSAAERYWYRPHWTPFALGPFFTIELVLTALLGISFIGFPLVVAHANETAHYNSNGTLIDDTYTNTLQNWVVFVLVYFNVFVVIRQFFCWATMFQTRFFEHSLITYYLVDVELSVSLAVWSLFLVLPPWEQIVHLDPPFDPTEALITRIYAAMWFLVRTITCICWLYFAREILVKYIMSQWDVTHFWNRMTQSLWKENILVKILTRLAPEIEDEASSERMKFPKPTTQPSKILQASSHPPVKKQKRYFPSFSSSGKIVAPKTPKPHALAFNELAKDVVQRNAMRITVSRIYNDTDTYDWKKQALTNEEREDELRSKAAKILGKFIFEKLDKTNRGYLVPDDFLVIFKKDKIQKLVAFYQLDDEGKLSEAAMVRTVQEIYKDRQILVSMLKDRYHISEVIKTPLNFGALVILIFAILLFLDISITTLALPAATFLLGLSFIFGNIVREAFESFIFLIFVNPFVNGDLVETSLFSGQIWITKITLLTTEAKTIYGKKLLIPNSSLYQSIITNYTNSGECAFALSFYVYIETPDEAIAELRADIIDFWKTDPKVWKKEGTSVKISSIPHPGAIEIAVWATVLHTWKNWEYGYPRGNLIMFIKNKFQKLNIKEYTKPRPFLKVDKTPYAQPSEYVNPATLMQEHRDRIQREQEEAALARENISEPTSEPISEPTYESEYPTSSIPTPQFLPPQYHTAHYPTSPFPRFPPEPKETVSAKNPLSRLAKPKSFVSTT